MFDIQPVLCEGAFLPLFSYAGIGGGTSFLDHPTILGYWSHNAEQPIRIIFKNNCMEITGILIFSGAAFNVLDRS